MKFKVGDLVVGNHKSRYPITREGWRGKVSHVCADGYHIYVKALPGHPGSDTEFLVGSRYFDLL